MLKLTSSGRPQKQFRCDVQYHCRTKAELILN